MRLPFPHSALPLVLWIYMLCASEMIAEDTSDRLSISLDPAEMPDGDFEWPLLVEEFLAEEFLADEFLADEFLADEFLAVELFPDDC